MTGGASCVGCASPCLSDWQTADALADALSVLKREVQPTERHFAHAKTIFHSARRESIRRDRVEVFVAPRPPAAKRRLALHEAGHSVVALDLGQAIGPVNIDDDATAECGEARNWRDAVIVDCAGLAAENGRSGVRSGVPRTRIDFAVLAVRGSAGRHGCDICRGVRAVLKANPDAEGADVVKMFDELHCRAFRRVQGRLWSAIERVAAALVTRGHLSGAEVRTIAGDGK